MYWAFTEEGLFVGRNAGAVALKAKIDRSGFYRKIKHMHNGQMYTSPYGTYSMGIGVPPQNIPPIKPREDEYHPQRERQSYSGFLLSNQHKRLEMGLNFYRST